MNKQSETTNKEKPVERPFPTITWRVKFHNLLPMEEIPGELPLIEQFLNGYIRQLLHIITRRKLNIHYRWVQPGRRSRTLTLHASVNTFTQPKGFTVRIVPVTIVKHEEQYHVRDINVLEPSTKNTVTLKPPSTAG